MCFWAPFLPVNRSPSFWTPFCLSSQPFVARCAASCTRHVPFSASWRLRSWRIAVWSRRRTTPNRRFLSAPRAPNSYSFALPTSFSPFPFSVRSFFTSSRSIRPLLLHFLPFHAFTLLLVSCSLRYRARLSLFVLLEVECPGYARQCVAWLHLETGWRQWGFGTYRATVLVPSIYIYMYILI